MYQIALVSNPSLVEIFFLANNLFIVQTFINFIPTGTRTHDLQHWSRACQSSHHWCVTPFLRQIIWFANFKKNYFFNIFSKSTTLRSMQVLYLCNKVHIIFCKGFAMILWTFSKWQWAIIGSILLQTQTLNKTVPPPFFFHLLIYSLMSDAHFRQIVLFWFCQAYGIINQ